MLSETGMANKIGYEKSFTVEYDNNQTAAALITPTTGTSIAVKGVYVSTESTDGGIRIYFSDDENDAVNTVYRYFAAGGQPGYIPLAITGDKNSVLQVTSDFGNGDNFFILLNYTEE